MRELLAQGNNRQEKRNIWPYTPLKTIKSTNASHVAQTQSIPAFDVRAQLQLPSKPTIGSVPDISKQETELQSTQCEPSFTEHSRATNSHDQPGTEQDYSYPYLLLIVLQTPGNAHA